MINANDKQLKFALMYIPTNWRVNKLSCPTRHETFRSPDVKVKDEPYHTVYATHSENYAICLHFTDNTIITRW